MAHCDCLLPIFSSWLLSITIIITICTICSVAEFSYLLMPNRARKFNKKWRIRQGYHLFPKIKIQCWCFVLVITSEDGVPELSGPIEKYTNDEMKI